jgi:hypothetical protein
MNMMKASNTDIDEASKLWMIDVRNYNNGQSKKIVFGEDRSQ